MADIEPRAEVTLLMDMMDQAWEHLKPLIDHEMPVATEIQPLRYTEQLLLSSGRNLLSFQYDKLSEADEELRDELEQPSEFASRASAEECVRRFLSRSYKCLRSNVDFYLKQLPLPKYATRASKYMDNYLRLVRSQLLHSKATAGFLVLDRLYLLPESEFDCERQTCGSVDHLHSVDGFAWPSHQRYLEQDIPLPAKTAITFRTFTLIVPSHEPDGHGCFASFINAVAKSLKYANEAVPLFPMKNAPELLEYFEDQIFIADLPSALSLVAEATVAHMQLPQNQLHLGIILPGGSQVFWPEKIDMQYASKFKSVYIKANFSVENKTTMLSFVPVKTKARSKKARLTQTVEFVQLPPEIRNTIYGLMLDDISDGHLPNRQPAMALTCHLVHKEIMSLLFKKYGYFVKM